MKKRGLVFLAMAMFFLGACAHTWEGSVGERIGAVAGGLTGLAIAKHDRALGAAVGAVAGAVLGGAIGDLVSSEEPGYYPQDPRRDPYPEPGYYPQRYPRYYDPYRRQTPGYHYNGVPNLDYPGTQEWSQGRYHYRVESWGGPYRNNYGQVCRQIREKVWYDGRLIKDEFKLICN